MVLNSQPGWWFLRWFLQTWSSDRTTFSQICLQYLSSGFKFCWTGRNSHLDVRIFKSSSFNHWQSQPNIIFQLCSEQEDRTQKLEKKSELCQDQPTEETSHPFCKILRPYLRGMQKSGGGGGGGLGLRGILGSSDLSAFPLLWVQTLHIWIRRSKASILPDSSLINYLFFLALSLRSSHRHFKSDTWCQAFALLGLI